jgi:plasmid maintenance system antidote protein VapI
MRIITNPSHPDEILKELIIEPLGTTITDVSKLLELAFNNPSADHWLRLQNAYDLWQSRQNISTLHVQAYQVAS